MSVTENSAVLLLLFLQVPCRSITFKTTAKTKLKLVPRRAINTLEQYITVKTPEMMLVKALLLRE